jgi:hypothetical protein
MQDGDWMRGYGVGEPVPLVRRCAAACGRHAPSIQALRLGDSPSMERPATKDPTAPMKITTLDCIEPLLTVLRGYSVLSEVRPAVFHLDGRDFIHFHAGPEGIVADVRLSSGQIRMSVSTPAEQSELLQRIEETLAALESRTRGNRTKRRGRNERDG